MQLAESLVLKGGRDVSDESVRLVRKDDKIVEDAWWTRLRDACHLEERSRPRRCGSLRLDPCSHGRYEEEEEQRTVRNRT